METSQLVESVKATVKPDNPAVDCGCTQCLKTGKVTALDLAAKLIAEPKIREELQSWINEIAASGSPWVHYLKARQMGLLSDQFRIVDLALETGLVSIPRSA